MNLVYSAYRGISEPEWMEQAGLFAQSVLSRLGKVDWDLSILYCDDSCIRELNREYRHKDEATDVLSFEQGETYNDESGETRFLAGDIVISLDTLVRNAGEFSVDMNEELRRLIVHGILHLEGLDHEDNEASRPMLVLQEEIMAALTSPNAS